MKYKEVNTEQFISKFDLFTLLVYGNYKLCSVVGSYEADRRRFKIIVQDECEIDWQLIVYYRFSIYDEIPLQKMDLEKFVDTMEMIRADIVSGNKISRYQLNIMSNYFFGAIE